MFSLKIANVLIGTDTDIILSEPMKHVLQDCDIFVLENKFVFKM